MSKFNSSISVNGIQDDKTRLALLKLLENCHYLQNQIARNKRESDEEIRRLKQKLSAKGGN